MKKNIILYIILLSLSAYGQTYRGFLPPRMTTTQRNAISTPAAGLMIYNTSTKCMEHWNSTIWVSRCGSAPGIISALQCSTATHNGTLIAGTYASVTSAIIYLGGNGGTHNGQTVNSTGVTGLTAKLDAGSFVNGAGSLTFTITGTPSGAGTASFAINIGGKTCTLTRQIIEPSVPTYSGCAWNLPKLGYNESSTGYINNKPITATLTAENNTQAYTNPGTATNCGIHAPTNYYTFGNNNNPSSLTMKFSRKVSNLAITIYGANKKENFIFTLKKNNTIVTSTNTIVAGNCPNNFNIYSSSIYCNNPPNPILIGQKAGASIIVNLGNVWFDEILISTNGTGNGSGISFCMGSTY